jgi:hypothetical protein
MKNNAVIKTHDYSYGQVKVPISYLNVALTSKSRTLEKIDRNVKELKSLRKNADDPKRKRIIGKQISAANEVVKRCSKNFIDDFSLSVYEKYATYGGLKILSNNNFRVTLFQFVDLLKVLGIEDRTTELKKIKAAMIGLTKKRFPCYMVFPDKKDVKKYHFIDADDPIFRIWPVGTLDLNCQADLRDIKRRKLYIQINNPTLIADLTDSRSLFYVMVHSELIVNLRAFKKVREWDLIFLEYLIKNGNFYKRGKPLRIRLCLLCKTIKKNDYLNKEGEFNNRLNANRFKKMIEKLCEFAVMENLLKDFSFEGRDVILEFRSLKPDLSDTGT